MVYSVEMQGKFGNMIDRKYTLRYTKTVGAAMAAPFFYERKRELHCNWYFRVI